LRKSPPQITYQCQCLRLAATVANSIVGGPFERYLAVLTLPQTCACSRSSVLSWPRQWNCLPFAHR
jgi:hypothetical protein